MSEKRKSRGIGPGAVTLILVILVVILGILAVLAAVSARNDSKLTDRGLEMTQVYYRLNTQAEHRYQELDQILCDLRQNGQTVTRDSLPDGMMMEDDRIRWTEADEEYGMILSCAVQLQPEGMTPRLQWTERVYKSVNTNETGDEEWN